MPKKARLAAALVIVIGVLVVGFADGFGGEGSAEPTVQEFLLDWQEGSYGQAATLTNGSARQVGTELAAAYTDLDATNAFFAMKSVTQHGDTAVATYLATVDLAEAGQQWSYVGKFGLTLKNGQWVVDWAPAVINPRLGPGDRLAVVTAYAPRAGIEDMNGQPLLAKSADYRIGVYPGRLKNAAATAAGFSGVAGLDDQQVLGQIQAAPPSDFLSLLTLDPADFGSLWPKLAKVPGLSYQQQTERLFDTSAQEVVGAVGTEDSSDLRAEGAAYQPGMTVGLSGLEQTDPGFADRDADDLRRRGERGRSQRRDAVDFAWRPRGHAGADHAEQPGADRRRERPRGTVELGGDRRRGLGHRGDPRGRVT